MNERAPTAIQILAVDGLGEVEPGTDIAAMITSALTTMAVTLEAGDVLVVSSKVISKSEGRFATPATDETAQDARRRLSLSDPDVADHVLVATPQVVVVRTPHGFVCANAGIDESNIPDGRLLLLPSDPDASAEAVRQAVAASTGVQVGVIVSDTFGRAWREGQTDVALGVAGIPALRDERGSVDRNGRTLHVTLVAVADQIAGAADLIRDKAAGIPVVIVRGLTLAGPDSTGQALVRPVETDLFAHGRGWLARRLAAGTDDSGSTRTGQPAEWEWDLVLTAAGGGVCDGHAVRTGQSLRLSSGLSAGRAEAALLDLGYPVLLTGDGPWKVTVTGTDQSSR